MIDCLKSYQGKMANFAKTFMIPRQEALNRGEEFKPEGFSNFEKIFFGFMEICETVETIEMILILVSINPPRSKKISVDLYFKHVISSYLSEVYILKERLNTYATKISRMYKKANLSHGIETNFDALYANIKNQLKDINSKRNDHVHNKRHSDDMLTSLALLKFVSDIDESFREGLNIQYKILKINWKQFMLANNEEMVKLLINYFDIIFEWITVDGDIVLPNRVTRGI